MRFIKKLYQVKPNTTGYLYRNNIFEQELQPGTYSVMDWKNRTELFVLPQTPQVLTIINQEVLSKDNVALRFSFFVVYKITNGSKLLSCFSLDKDSALLVAELEQRLRNIVQVHLRNRIAGMECETLNENRDELTDFTSESMTQEVAALGVEVERVTLRDLTFPKSIQDLFAKHLEAKIRSKADLENARTAVATARTLKNASELMKDDDNIKFFQLIETINKIAEKGRHTFMIGDLNQVVKR